MTTTLTEEHISTTEAQDCSSKTQNIYSAINYQKQGADKIQILYFLSDNLIVPVNDFINIQNRLSKKQSAIFNQLCRDIDNAIVCEKESLEEQGIALPTEKVISDSKQLLYELVQYNIFPEEISTTAEEGICLTFQKENRRMFLEVYNDEEIGYIIEDINKKQLLENKDLHSLTQTKERIINFFD